MSLLIPFLLLALSLLFISLIGLSAVKFEGAFVSSFFLLAVLLTRCWDRPISWRELRNVSLLLVVFLIPIFWQIWLRSHHVTFQIFHLQRGPAIENVRIVFAMVVSFMLQSENTLLILLSIAFLILSKKPTQWVRSQKALGVFCCTLIGFSLFAGVCWPPKEFYMYYPEVLMRLLTRSGPFVVLFWASQALEESEGTYD